MSTAEKIEPLNLDTFHEAVVVVKRDTLRQKAISELKKHGSVNVTISENLKEIGNVLKKFPMAILVIDFDFGKDFVVQVLEKAKCPFKADVRPLYLLCRTIDRDVMALATDYNVLRMRGGEVSGNDIHKDIHDIYVYENISEENRAMLHKVAVLRSKGEWKKAGSNLVKALKKDSDNLKIKVELAENLIVTGDAESAKKFLDEVLAEKPKHIRAMSLLARIHMKLGNFDKGAKILEKIQIFNPQNVERLVDLGQCFLNQNLLDKAENCFDEALKVDGDNKRASSGKGQISLVQGDVENALSYFKDSTEEEIAALFNNSAIICMKQERFEEGIQLYRAAKLQVEKNKAILARVVFNMGLGFLKWDKKEEAIKAFKEAAKLDPEFVKATHNAKAMEKNSPKGSSKAKSSDDVIDMGVSGDQQNDEADDLGGDLSDLFGSGFDLDDSLFESLAQ